MKKLSVIILLVSTFPLVSMAQLDGVDKLIRLSYTEWRAVCETVTGEYFTKTVKTNDILADNVCEPGGDTVDASNECLDEAKSKLNSSYYNTPSELFELTDACSVATPATVLCMDDSFNTLNSSYYNTRAEMIEIIGECTKVQSSEGVECVGFAKSKLNSSYYNTSSELFELINACSPADKSTVPCLDNLTSSLNSSYYNTASEMIDLINQCL